MKGGYCPGRNDAVWRNSDRVLVAYSPPLTKEISPELTSGKCEHGKALRVVGEMQATGDRKKEGRLVSCLRANACLGENRARRTRV